MATWSNICQLIKYADKTSELSYQKSLKEMVFEVGLGWKSYQIKEQPSLQLGATDRLIPDMVISTDDECFVVEIKKPGHIKSDKDVSQLISYMKQLETPVGIYIGDTIEVYYKEFVYGFQPTNVLSLRFTPDNITGETFVMLFSADSFSVDAIRTYVEKTKEKIEFENNVKNLIEKLSSTEFIDELNTIIAATLENQGLKSPIINKALTEINISISPKANPEIVPSEKYEKAKESHNYNHTKRIGGYKVTARNYAYDLIRQIIEKNYHLIYRQLFAIFNKKNYIIDISEINEEEKLRWFLDEDDIITLRDGTKVAISNQWGFNNNCEAKMNRLKDIAKKYNIDTNRR